MICFDDLSLLCVAISAFLHFRVHTNFASFQALLIIIKLYTVNMPSPILISCSFGVEIIIFNIDGQHAGNS